MFKRIASVFSLGSGGFPTRTDGIPTSSNGASSFHLRWETPREPLREASAIFEVIEPPAVDSLYFWALQVGFAEGNELRGAAHVGLQHHPAYPHNGAVNWGGYQPDGTELTGSEAKLPSTLANANTRDYQWHPNRQYRYRVSPSPAGGWRATITDETTGEETIIRDLYVKADRIVAPMVWTEAFCDCAASSVAVRWSDLTVVDAQHQIYAIRRTQTSYQRFEAGGCTNTSSDTDHIGFIQRTNTQRSTPDGESLRLG